MTIEELKKVFEEYEDSVEVFFEKDGAVFPISGTYDDECRPRTMGLVIEGENYPLPPL